MTADVKRQAGPHLSDSDLVSRIALGDEEAFRGLFRRYAPIAIASARRTLCLSSLAEEAVQEAFLAIWRDAGDYDERRGSVRSWVMTLVHRRAVDLVRREESQKQRAIASQAKTTVEERDFGDDVVDDLGAQQEHDVLRSALDTLPAEQRAVIELMYFGGLSQSKVAVHLEIPLGTVKSRTTLGMRRLRASLAGSTADRAPERTPLGLAAGYTAAPPPNRQPWSTARPAIDA